MGKQVTSYVPDDQLRDAEVRWLIDTAQLNHTVFLTLTASEQDRVRRVLFEKHTTQIAMAPTLSGLEFSVMAALKLVFKLLKGETLTETEHAFVTALETVIQQHPMPLDPATWEVGYLDARIKETLANREAYKQKKIEITGEF